MHQFLEGPVVPRIATIMSGALLCLAASAVARAEVVVNVSTSQQRFAVTVDGAELYRWPVSTGRRGLETPSGDFRPIRFERKWYSRKYDWSPMPYSIFFHRGYAVHGTYEKRNLGRAVSHGCVRLLPAHAAILFALARREGRGNTRIVVTNGPLPGAIPGAAVTAAPARAIDKPVRVMTRHEPMPMPRPRAAIPAPERREVTRRDITPRAEPSRRNASFVAVGDEAAVMRGREAWLRSLDRKYGITR